MENKAKREAAVLTENEKLMAGILNGLKPEQANRVMLMGIGYMAGRADTEKKLDALRA